MQDEEWDDEDDGLGAPEGKGEFDYLSCKSAQSNPGPLVSIAHRLMRVAWLDDGGGGDNEAQDDDEDLRTDPIAQIDMVVSLRSYTPRSTIIIELTTV